jgi:hypothetical protein
VSDGGEYTWLNLPSGTFLPAGPWQAVMGGDLPVPVKVRIHRHADGRYAITGLVIGDESRPQEITSQTLRQIRPGKILASMFADDFDPDNPQDWLDQPQGAARVIADINADAGGHVATGGAPARGPDDTKLREFAHTYRTELVRHPRRAMTAAAKAHNISRATANRWAALCRQLGYLPGSGPG